MNFQEQLQVHLTAIQQRDLPAFLSTMTQGEAVSCILPNGKYFERRSAFVDFTRDWFADPDWQITFELLKTIETAEMSIALLSVHYADKDATGTPYQLNYYLSLGFVLEDGAWRLVFDQNTLCKG